MKQNIKLKKSAKLTALSILFVLLLLAESVVNAVEHPEILAKNLSSTPEGFGVEVCLSATDRDVDNNGLDVYPGDTVTANIRVTGGSFEGAKLGFSFDTAAFCLETADVSWETVTAGEYRFCSAVAPETKYDSGTVVGSFVFRALPLSESAECAFSVSGEPAYVVADWGDGWSENAENIVPAERLTDGRATVVLRGMTVNISECTDLIYEAKEQNLVKSGYIALDNITHENLTDVAISYCLLTKAQAIGGIAPEVYTPAIPSAINAGEYRVYYKAEKAGYKPFYSYVGVSVQKKNTFVEWVADGFNTGKIPGNTVGDFWAVYNDGNPFAYPVARYVAADNTIQNAVVTMITPASGSFSEVGFYTFQAEISDNYNVNNGTCVAVIDGAQIEGYSFENPAGNRIWYDGESHLIAELSAAENATEGVAVSYSTDNGKTWDETAPSATSEGTYTVKAKLSKLGYYDKILTYEFKIKACIYEVEKSEFIAGWDLILVYTNDDLPGFKYADCLMYDLTSLGYRLGSVFDPQNEQLIQTGKEYARVFGYLVMGNANLTLICSSNLQALSVKSAAENTQTVSRCDVNGSNSVDINDLVAVQAVYNVDRNYFSNMKDTMPIILKSDVSGDKKVNIYDATLVKSYGELQNH